jgi:hypothetical protein
LLFGLEELEGHRFGVVGFEELLAFVLEGADAALLDEALFFGEVPLFGEFLLEQSSQLFDQVSARRDGAVVLLDEPFDVFGLLKCSEESGRGQWGIPWIC